LIRSAIYGLLATSLHWINFLNNKCSSLIAECHNR